MIPIKYIEEQRGNIPWQMDAFIEQDMIITKALITLYNNKHISENLLFRGGTALDKLYIKPPSRYSEDIDLVQKKILSYW